VGPFEGILLSVVFCLGASISAAQSQPSPAQLAASQSSITLPPGTKIQLAVVRPVWAISAKAGDPFYAQVSFPAVAGDRVAIPAGAYVLGTIEDVTRPKRRTNCAEIDVLFTKIIFANGYAVELAGAAVSAAAAPAATTAPQTSAPAGAQIAIKVQVSTANDLLLDNGAQVEMTLEAPVTLDASKVAVDLRLERPPQSQLFHSATRCRSIPGTPGTLGTPGTPDTVIPGSPGTPDTVVPGGPGMPDTVIPGTPATPPTVIPGSPGTPGAPGTPGIACPPAPLVISSAPIAPGKPAQTPQPAAAN